MVYFEVTNPAIAFFYLITGLHGLHLLGGLVAWGRTVAKVWGDFDVAKMRQSVELCTVYWHFLLLVWLVLFGLLFSGNNLDLLLTDLWDQINKPNAHDASYSDKYRQNRSRCLKACKASSPTGPRTSARSRRCPGARP